LYIAFDFFPQARRANVDWSKTPVQLPVMPSALGDLEQRLTSIVAKIDAVPYQAIGEDARAALQQITALGAQAQALVQRVDAQAVPELKPALEAIRHAAESADRALRSSDANLLGADAPAQQELRRALQEVTRAARSLRVLADYLETHPEALIRGKTEDRP
jgi:paraquat-inducible protein B